MNATVNPMLQIFESKTSASCLFSSLFATHKTIRGSYHVETADHCIFFEVETVAALQKLNGTGVSESHTTFALEPALTAKQI